MSHNCFHNFTQISASSPFNKIYSLQSMVLSSSCMLSSPRKLWKTPNAWAPTSRDWLSSGLGGARGFCSLKEPQVMKGELRPTYWTLLFLAKTLTDRVPSECYLLLLRFLPPTTLFLQCWLSSFPPPTEEKTFTQRLSQVLKITCVLNDREGIQLIWLKSSCLLRFFH